MFRASYGRNMFAWFVAVLPFPLPLVTLLQGVNCHWHSSVSVFSGEGGEYVGWQGRQSTYSLCQCSLTICLICYLPYHVASQSACLPPCLPPPFLSIHCSLVSYNFSVFYPLVYFCATVVAHSKNPFRMSLVVHSFVVVPYLWSPISTCPVHQNLKLFRHDFTCQNDNISLKRHA